MKRELKQCDPFNTIYFSDYYQNYRNKKEDLFDSEKYFFDKFANQIISVLDVGCATGGMYEIISDFNQDIKYEGIDISENLIKIARKSYPAVNFKLGDGSILKYKDNSFEGIVSFGTTVHDQNWENLLRECFRVSEKSFLFDVRLTQHKTISKINDAFVLDGSGLNIHI